MLCSFLEREEQKGWRRETEEEGVRKLLSTDVRPQSPTKVMDWEYNPAQAVMSQLAKTSQPDHRVWIGRKLESAVRSRLKSVLQFDKINFFWVSYAGAQSQVFGLPATALSAFTAKWKFPLGKAFWKHQQSFILTELKSMNVLKAKGFLNKYSPGIIIIISLLFS